MINGFKKWVRKKLLQTHFGQKLLHHYYINRYQVINRQRKMNTDNKFLLFNIELTNKCPMKCIMCARTHSMTREIGDMSFGVFQKAIDELVEHNLEGASSHDIWFHHFGESLKHPEFAKFIAYASQKGIKTCLSLNPVMLTDENIYKLLDSKIKKLYLSLDGHDDESFEKIRGMKNAYEKSKERTLRLLEEKQKQQASVEIILSMIDFSNNEESIQKVRSFWEIQEGLDSFLLKTFKRWDGSVDEVNALEGNSDSVMFEMQNRAVVTCNFPWESMSIMWNGDVVPCCHDYNGKYVYGNVEHETLSEIWNGARIQKLRQEFKENRVSNDLCRVCQELYALPILHRES